MHRAADEQPVKTDCGCRQEAPLSKEKFVCSVLFLQFGIDHQNYDEISVVRFEEFCEESRPAYQDAVDSTVGTKYLILFRQTSGVLRYIETSEPFRRSAWVLFRVCSLSIRI